jgi:hypothetical protein
MDNLSESGDASAFREGPTASNFADYILAVPPSMRSADANASRVERAAEAKPDVTETRPTNASNDPFAKFLNRYKAAGTTSGGGDHMPSDRMPGSGGDSSPDVKPPEPKPPQPDPDQPKPRPRPRPPCPGPT